MTLQEIINEADLLVDNPFELKDKIQWLNEVNQVFFEVVKIPSSIEFSSVVGVQKYPLSSDVRNNNIDRVTLGTLIYGNFLKDNVPVGMNYFIFKDDTQEIHLYPPPIRSSVGMVRYHQIATTKFTDADLTVKPDAPDEYHWIYTLGLCEKMAKAIPDVSLGNNYAMDFQKNLIIAQQNYKAG